MDELTRIPWYKILPERLHHQLSDNLITPSSPNQMMCILDFVHQTMEQVKVLFFYSNYNIDKNLSNKVTSTLLFRKMRGREHSTSCERFGH